MGAFVVAGVGLGYYLLIFAISRYVGRGNDSSEYLKTEAPAWLATLGIVGDMISGVTYLSVPGTVADKGFGYLAICLGNTVGYLLIAIFFLPLYHGKNRVSLYEWIGSVLGVEAQRVCSGLFIVSRLLGSSARLCLTAGVFHVLVFSEFAIGAELSIVAVTLGISLYTLRSGIKSLIVTDLVQSAFLVGGVLAAMAALASFLRAGNVPLDFLRPVVGADGWTGFGRSFFSGILITLAMSGLDQNIMQKTFSVSDLPALRRSFARLGMIVLGVNLLVLIQGALLSDALKFFPGLADQPGDLRLIGFMRDSGSPILSVLFLVGLAAATLNSADSVITTLTSSIRVDLWKEKAWSLTRIHWLVTALLAGLSVLIYRLSELSAIEFVLRSAGWTYGPLLGIFLIAALGLRSDRVSLRAALVCAWGCALIWSYVTPLGVEVIAVLAFLLLFGNFIFSFRREAGQR